MGADLNQAALGPGMCRLPGVALRSSLGKIGSAEGRCQVAEPPEPPCLSWLVESTHKSEGWEGVVVWSAAAPQSQGLPVLGQICKEVTISIRRTWTRTRGFRTRLAGCHRACMATESQSLGLHGCAHRRASSGH